MNRKCKVAIFCLVVLIIGTSLLIRRNVLIKRAEEARYEEQILYKRQNKAFGLSEDNFDNRIFYHGADELEKPQVVIDIYVYNSDQDEYNLTLDDVTAYFENEYDSNGELMIYSCPKEILDYISWWHHGGEKKIIYYRSDLNYFLRKKGESVHVTDRSYEEVEEIIAEYESQGGVPDDTLN